MEHILSFLKYLEFEKRYSNRTIESYQIDLMQFLDFCAKIANIQELTLVQSIVMRDWIVYLLDSGISNRSVNRKISAVKSLFKYLLRKGIILTNPLSRIESLKNKKRLPVFVTEAKMDLLLDEKIWENNFSGIRNRLIIEVFYLTGIRLSELINLKVYDIDISSSLIKVLGKRNKERIVPISKELKVSIEEYIDFKYQLFGKLEHDFLFVTHKGEKLYSKLVYRIVKDLLTAITTMDKKSPHVLRHTFATHMLNNGAGINAIKELLGHANLAATQVYTHNTFEKLKKIYKLAHPRA